MAINGPSVYNSQDVNIGSGKCVYMCMCMYIYMLVYVHTYTIFYVYSMSFVIDNYCAMMSIISLITLANS